MRIITILGTQGCHLCEEVWWQLAPHSAQYQWQIEQRDIAEGPDANEMIEKFGLRIPVLMYGTHEYQGELSASSLYDWLVMVDSQ